MAWRDWLGFNDAAEAATLRRLQAADSKPATAGDIRRLIDAVNARTGLILTRMGKLEAKMAATWDDITAKLKRLKTVEDSVVSLLGNVAAQLRDADTPAQRQQLADELDQRADVLAAAVTANTVAMPPPTTPPGEGVPIEPPPATPGNLADTEQPAPGNV